MKVDDDGEYAFRVTADPSSKVALSVSGQEIFNAIVEPSRRAAAAAAAANETDQYATPSATATAAAAAAGSVASFTEIMSETRTGSLQLKAGQLVPLQLRYVVSIQRFSRTL